MSTERTAVYTFGPRFFVEDGKEMFEFTIDHGSKIGPRPATQADHDKYPDQPVEPPQGGLGEGTEPEVAGTGIANTGQPRQPPRRPPWPPKRSK